MKRSLAMLSLIAATALPDAPTRAQNPQTPPTPPAPCRKLLCAPSLLFQPGIMVTNALSARVITASGEKAERRVTPLVRIATVAPTRYSRVALVGVLWYTPFLTTETKNPTTGAVTGEVVGNAPNFLIGPNFTLVRTTPIVVQLAVVDGYRRYEARDENNKLDQYRHNLILAPAVNLRFASFISPTGPAMLRSMTAYAIWQQQLTNMPYNVGPNGQLTTERAYTPGLFFGLSVPIAPSW